MSGRRRPWRVFVRSIGPSFSYATEDRARTKAIALADEYAEILVYNILSAHMTRTRYLYGGTVIEETLNGGVWS